MPPPAESRLGRLPVLVTRRMSSHAAASGYDRLEDFIRCEKVSSPRPHGFVERAVARAFRARTQKSGLRWYHDRSLLAELRAAKLWLRSPGRVFHFLYAENSYRYLANMRKVRRNAIVCTYHVPPQKFDEVVSERRHLARLDAVIVVARVQAELFEPYMRPDRVFFVPHGIDVDYFRPRAERVGGRETFDCLFVGTHLRDLDTLAKAAKELDAEGNIRVVVVTRPENFARFDGIDCVECLTGVSDASLLELFQDSDLLLFPLLDCTANNTLLEAMACGLPLVTTDLPGVRDYVSSDCAILTPKSGVREIVEAVIGLKRNRVRLMQMAEASRARAVELRWENVAERTVEIYEIVTADLRDMK